MQEARGSQNINLTKGISQLICYKQALEDTNAALEDECHYGRSVSEAAQYRKLWLLSAPRY